MYTNGVYKVYTERDRVLVGGGDWVCELTVDNFTVKSEGCYTRWGAMRESNKMMARKYRYWNKMKEQRDVIEDIFAETVVKEFIDRICDKAKEEHD